MKYPNLNEEKKLWKKGYRMVVGIDEAGRGPLAGPVVAAAVTINSKLKTQNSKPQLKTKNLRDSKKLSPKKREELYEVLTKNPNVEWGIGRVSEKVIDKINILQATKLAMIKAVKNLEKKLEKKSKQSVWQNFQCKQEIKKPVEFPRAIFSEICSLYWSRNILFCF